MQIRQRAATPIRALRLPKVLEKTGLSRTHLYRLIQQRHFIKLSERASTWNESIIDAWLTEKFEGGSHV